MPTSERRCVPTQFEIRAKQDGTGSTKYVIEGHGAVFNRLSQNLGGFVEQVDPGAFKRTLGDNPDARGLINHDPSLLLGRTRSGTMRLSTDNIGLAYEIDSPDTQYARDLIVSMERGDIDQSSFAFYVMPNGDEWGQTDQGMPLRTLTALSIHNGDVSPVTYPAYEDANSGIAGRAFSSLAEARGLDVAAVRAAAETGLLADLISGVVEPALAEDLGATRSAAFADRRRQLDLLQVQRRDLG
jgi:HK97 family phage prohead protease